MCEHLGDGHSELGVAAHPGTCAGGEHESFSITWSFGGARFQNLHGLPVEGCGSVLAAFAVAEDVRTHTQMEVTDLESGQLADAQPGGRTGDTWRNLRHELDRMQRVTLATADGRVAQRSTLTTGQKAILAALDLPEPPKYLDFTPSTDAAVTD